MGVFVIVFAASVAGGELIVRARKDAARCNPAAFGRQLFYDAAKFTPEQVRKDGSIPRKTIKLFYGGKRRRIRYKEVAEVLWQGSTPSPAFVRHRPPAPNRKSQSRKLHYRNPAYLLTSIAHC